jgi:hypothetical protein
VRRETTASAWAPAIASRASESSSVIGRIKKVHRRKKLATGGMLLTKRRDGLVSEMVGA